MMQNYNLLDLYKEPDVNALSKFCNVTTLLNSNLDKLVTAYKKLRSAAPRRHERDKEYFVGDHPGRPKRDIESSRIGFNRSEEYLAMALFNDLNHSGTVEHPEISSLQILDYQFPLKARRTDKGVGKVDLFSVIDGIHPCAIELKISPKDSEKLGDTPLHALLQALAYCAIVEANMDDIASEASKKYKLNLQTNQPHLMVMAPMQYWCKYKQRESTRDWQPALQKLAAGITERIDLPVYFVALHNIKFDMGGDGQKPHLRENCILKPVSLRK